MAAEPARRYLGKYRGTVEDTADPLGIGRITAKVPDVLGDEPSTWALPSFPVAGPGMGHYAVPPSGAGVWLEFEQGDINFPVWTGCWYGSSAEVPQAADAGLTGRRNTVLQTGLQCRIVLSDDPETGLTLKAPNGASIVVNASGIHIDNGNGAKVSLSGNTVTINDDAFSVT
ncbi:MULTISPECIES: phage baseplate assembly protein V [Streptomyces]|jgi:hypothetical protein|uniref:Baseplate assembly protein n=1 Tax=Streptomyces triticiradicis TaxID=2651189 RepID=A0A7J5DN01_9ACTN|nr:phage baseplate assembly protein V [Streptomyces triticiradicis]KAB1990054.1 baseplate assembly protein [Streptomyces triticiradicis]